MAEYYNIVPWLNSKEWLDICDKLHPTKTLECKKAALEQLLVWKARCPFLPSGIECTLTLLEVIIKDAGTSDTHDASIDQLLRLAYSTAVMRFVNHMFDGETAKGTSLYQAAINLNVPSWLVDLRHDTAHSNTLPTLQLLRDASELSCSWLYEQYWLKHKPYVCDYIINDKVVKDENEHKIGTLINLCMSLGICANSRSKIKNLADIPDMYMRESIMNDLRDLFGNSIDVTNMKTISIISLINLMTTQSEKLLQVKDAASHINKALLSDDSMILSLELLKHLDKNAILHKRSLRKQYVQCFEVLLIFLHTTDLLQDFLLELMHLTQKHDIDANKRLLAALWVGEILKGLKRCRDFSEKMKNVSPDNYPKKRKELRSLYHHWFPSDNNNVLILDLQKPVPHDLTNIHFIQPVISSYNPYLTYFIKNLLHIIQPQLPDVIIDKICKLSELIAFPHKFPATSTKIYTTSDLKTDRYSNTEEAENDVDIKVVEPSAKITNHLSQTSQKKGIWKISASDNRWTSCPIGVLFWQMNSEIDKNSKAMEMDIS